MTKEQLDSMQSLMDKYKALGWVFHINGGGGYRKDDYIIYFRTPAFVNTYISYPIYEAIDEDGLLREEASAVVNQKFRYKIEDMLDKVRDNLLNQLSILVKQGKELPKEITINNIEIKL